MPTIYTLPEGSVSVSGGGEISGYTQGDGSHLQDLEITLNNNSWVPVEITDNDGNFEDNDSSQTLTNGISYGGTNYSAGARVEAEYTLTVEDPDGNEYTLIGFNIVEGGGNSYGTIEGLAFVGDTGEFPPIGVPLTVTGTSEGPGGNTTPYNDYADPPCFCAGTLIETDMGPRPVEALKVGDLIKTRDNGYQPLRWIGHAEISREMLAARPELRPVRIHANAFGAGLPENDLHVSPQHRVLISDWRALVYFGEEEVLASAIHLENGETIQQDEDCESTAYFHLLFDAHQVIYSNGLPTESFLPGPQTCNGLEQAVQEELFAIFPQLEQNWGGFEAARTCLKSHQTLAVVKRARAISPGQSNREVAS
ncbi:MULTISPECIES: Hint domain-containing protein [Halocynthiibacter]|uniref:Hint domain-containing protein n=1 Tax=Halocynthiibacter halioticoli TaxID=2986804 RepID=A0AAE3J3C9_9RHOB|nr:MULTISPECIES: Hint domain-containing protein [Halocynthiibacter]MCV6825706.1 Hint domain-containing protein [Halocynthiibacter halioticoli]MCW4058707.1 Hint domain-containing protein [Halocynthiibacter sp. SDUM655004]